MSSFSALLRCVYLFNFAPALSLLFPRSCAVSSFSILLLRCDYFFHAAALCLLFHAARLRLRSCAVSGISVGRGGGLGQSDKKALTTFFFSLVLSLFYRSQLVNFKENYHFSKFRRGSNFFQVWGDPTFSREGVQLLIPIRTSYNL